MQIDQHGIDLIFGKVETEKKMAAAVKLKQRAGTSALAAGHTGFAKPAISNELIG